MSIRITRPAAISFERLAGAALGAMCGDALGMPVEGWSAEAIRQKYGRLDAMQPGRLPAGSYTDDSQMMIAILETLANRGYLDGPELAKRFVNVYEPWRGYGGRIPGIMERLSTGIAWDKAGSDSYGNGGAMRVGPLGAFYTDDLIACKRAAYDQCRITHYHPQGLAGTVAQALSVAIICRLGAYGSKPEPKHFIEKIARNVEDIDMHTATRLRDMLSLPFCIEEEVTTSLNKLYACDLTAAESIPPALGVFLAANSAEQALVMAVGLGGDTDTIGAMTGALAGAYWGIESLPSHWVQNLENGDHGRDYVLELCRAALRTKRS